MNASNQGFINLHNDSGILIITLASFLLLAMIVFGVTVARTSEAKARAQRAALKEELEKQKKDETA